MSNNKMSKPAKILSAVIVFFLLFGLAFATFAFVDNNKKSSERYSQQQKKEEQEKKRSC